MVSTLPTHVMQVHQLTPVAAGEALLLALLLSLDRHHTKPHTLTAKPTHCSKQSAATICEGTPRCTCQVQLAVIANCRCNPAGTPWKATAAAGTSC